MQFIKDLREATDTLRELVADDVRHEEDAKLDLAVSAQSFAQETREVVDDKLSFSATLMRAGEVDAAKRLLAEVEAEVRDNEVALIEQVNEVRVARAARRERITRVRLARSLAAAMLGAVVMATSAAGMAFASFLDDRAESADAAAGRAARDGNGGAGRSAQAAVAPRKAADRKKGKVEFGGVTRVLTPKALAAYEQLRSGDLGAGEMEHLLSLLPDDLANTMREVLTTATVAEKKVKDAVETIVSRTWRTKDRGDKSSEEASADEPAAEQPADEEEKEETTEPSPSPSPSTGEEPGEDPEDPDDTMGLPDLGPN